MIELTKEERKLAKELLRTGILRRHAEWLEEIKALLDQPLSEKQNEFDRSMTITDKSRKFYKEAMAMEEFYRTSYLLIGLGQLKAGGYLTEEDLRAIPADSTIRRFLNTL